MEVVSAHYITGVFFPRLGSDSTVVVVVSNLFGVRKLRCQMMVVCFQGEFTSCPSVKGISGKLLQWGDEIFFRAFLDVAAIRGKIFTCVRDK